MAIIIKSDKEIEIMRAAGRIVAKAHKLIEENVRPGITTLELDKIAYDYIIGQGAIPSFKGYQTHESGPKYPGSICASVNEQVIHGVPNNKKLLTGDIISVDIGAYLNGFHGDAARTYAVGEVDDEAKKLIRVTRESFFEAIKFAKAGNHLHKLGEVIQQYVESNGFSVVRDFVGHGVGKDLHEDPQIPHYKQLTRGPKLRKGMTIAVEPMVNMGDYEVDFSDDGWTITTLDGSLSAHYENTILITDNEAEILTRCDDDE